MGRILAFIVLLVFAAVLGTCAHAEPLTVGLHVGSVHFPAKGQNNVNPGLYVRTGDWTIGAYHNSYRETTAYAAHKLTTLGPFDVVGGIAYGYQRHSVGGREYGASPGALAPMVGLTYAPSIRILGAQPRFWMLPPTPKNSGVAHLSLEF